MLSSYQESIAIFLGVNVLMAFSVYVPTSAGLISLGQAGFMAIGAYASAYLTSRFTAFDVPFGLALFLGGAAAGIVGVLVAAPAVRIRGIYLIIATLGFGEIVRVLFVNFEPLGGASGLSGIQPLTTLSWVVAICLFFFVFLWRLRSTPLGRAFVAIHEDETAAEAMGINLFRTKLMAFGGGAFIAGIAGGLYAHFALFIDPSQFGFSKSAEAFLFVILGGSVNPLGPVAGAIVVTLLPEFLRFLQDWRMSFFAVLLIACAVWRPGGLISYRRAAHP
ncbi:branched-chain amino acid ABC transporter permease [Roseiarcaceae bacterium H3SJ34-1]|uniref:branched-chain amino acid ABC transporter permease n=1 Tax=Terripilifer ovatus TaxID=3032367 RepID=UPI003AB96082|nr:branched-chain amino acid ABC transporter permease [Roseiarcaceae bacterium H3SJ34-1]